MSFLNEFERWSGLLFLLVLVIIIAMWSGKLIYDIYNPPPQQEIIFNVTGIVNATNSSVVSFQFECIKYCIDKRMTEYENSCIDKCLELGKNGCDYT